MPWISNGVVIFVIPLVSVLSMRARGHEKLIAGAPSARRQNPIDDQLYAKEYSGDKP
jgi:hypothetical protein